MGGTSTARPTANGTSSRASRSRANAAAGRVRIAYRTPIPETRNSSGIPHNDPHSKKMVKPALGRGSFTNHEAPAANTTAEWKTTSPATTNARITSSSGRRLAGDGGTGASWAAAGPATAAVTEPSRPSPFAGECGRIATPGGQGPARLSPVPTIAGGPGPGQVRA